MESRVFPGLFQVVDRTLELTLFSVDDTHSIVNVRRIGPDFQQLLELLERLLQPASPDPVKSQVSSGLNVVGPEFNGLLEGFFKQLRPIHPLVDDPHQVVSFGNLRRQLQEFRQAGESRLELSLLVGVERLGVVLANESGRIPLVSSETPWNNKQIEEEPDKRKCWPGTWCHGGFSLP